MVAQTRIPAPDNEQLARQLEELADLLEDQEANPYRVRAYRNGAQTVRDLSQPAHEILDLEGRAGLETLSGIGTGLSRILEQLILAGRSSLLEELRGASGAAAVLATVPGVGPELAERIHTRLGIQSLEELEEAAHDGRLDQVPGFGPRRVRAVRQSLAGRFRRPRRVVASAREPGVAELLDVDREYREKVAADRLRKIAPRRFNPTGNAWLPVLNTRRGRHRYSALYSNTALAHRLGTTHDWVVIYLDDDGSAGQWTVVTAKTGPLQGKRVVRGREAECSGHYAEQAEAVTGP